MKYTVLFVCFLFSSFFLTTNGFAENTHITVAPKLEQPHYQLPPQTETSNINDSQDSQYEGKMKFKEFNEKLHANEKPVIDDPRTLKMDR